MERGWREGVEAGAALDSLLSLMYAFSHRRRRHRRRTDRRFDDGAMYSLVNLATNKLRPTDALARRCRFSAFSLHQGASCSRSQSED